MPNKAIAAGGSTAVAGAITTILLSLLGHPVPPEVAGSITTLVSAVISSLATYFTRFEGTTP